MYVQNVQLSCCHQYDYFPLLPSFSLSHTHTQIMNYVERVQFITHPSFKDSIVVQERSPFQITSIGWGYFDARVVLHFHKEYAKPSLTVIHQLAFQDDGSFQLLETDFPKHTIAQVQQTRATLDTLDNAPSSTNGQSAPIIIDLDNEDALVDDSHEQIVLESDSECNADSEEEEEEDMEDFSEEIDADDEEDEEEEEVEVEENLIKRTEDANWVNNVEHVSEVCAAEDLDFNLADSDDES